MYVCAKLKYVWTSQPPSMPLAYYEFEFRYAHTDERLKGKGKGARTNIRLSHFLLISPAKWYVGGIHVLSSGDS